MPIWFLPAIGSLSAGTAAGIKGAITAAGIYSIFDPIKTAIENIINEYIASDSWRDLIMNRVNPLVVQEIFNRTGLRLDDADPFSKISISTALSAKMGITLNDISDRNQVMRDLGNAAAELINLQTGMTLPALQLNNPTQLRAAFRDELAIQATNALAGQLSVLDDATLAVIKAAALADAYGMPPPTVTPTKKQLQQRAASRAYYDREYGAGRRRVWLDRPALPPPDDD